jgi:hypothetical protein
MSESAAEWGEKGELWESENVTIEKCSRAFICADVKMVVIRFDEGRGSLKYQTNSILTRMIPRGAVSFHVFSKRE